MCMYVCMCARTFCMRVCMYVCIYDWLDGQMYDCVCMYVRMYV